MADLDGLADGHPVRTGGRRRLRGDLDGPLGRLDVDHPVPGEQLLRLLRLITFGMLVVAYVIELLLETVSGPPDKGFDLRSEGRYIGCCGLLRRIAASAAFSNGGIYAVKLGGFDLPLAELVFRAGDLAAFDCL